MPPAASFFREVRHLMQLANSGECEASGLTNRQKLIQMFGCLSNGARQAQLSEVMGEDAVDIIQLSVGHRLLRLHDRNVVADTCVITLARQLEILLRHLNILSSYRYLANGCPKVKESLSNIGLHLRAKVLEFSLPLRQSRRSLLDVAFDPTTLPDRNSDTADHSEGSMSLRRVRADHAIIGAQR